MDKQSLQNLCEYVEKKLQSKNHVTILRHNNVSHFDTLKEMWDSGHKSFKYNEKRYSIEFSPSHETVGNRSSCDEFTVRPYKASSIFDATAVLAKKEISVMDWRGGTERLEKCGLSKINGEYCYVYDEGDDTLNQIVDSIMRHSNHNIMIMRHKTGDITVAIDDHRFQQR